MNFTTTKEKLLAGVLAADRVTGKRETLPVLSCILFDVEKDIGVRATNLEAGVEIHIPGDVTRRGGVAVSAPVLSQTLRSISGDKVTLKTDEGNLVVESKGTKTIIKSVPHDEFPALSYDSKKSESIDVDRGGLIQSIQSVFYAASPSMIRPELGSVYMLVSKGHLVCVATDSFRLAEKISGSNKGSSVEVLLPLKHALELVHVLESMGGENVTVSTDESQVVVWGEGTRFVSRVVNGNFPNYKEIIPRSFTTEATILKNDFSEVLKKARVFSGNDQHVGFHVYPKKKTFTATARSSDVGEMSDSVDAALSGEDLDINFHIGYLSDCLSSIASDSLVLGFAGAGKPLVIRGVSDPSFTYLVMPLNR